MGGSAGQVSERRGNVGSTRAARNGGLVRAEVRLDDRASRSGKDRTEEPTEAARELERAKAGRCVGAWGLHNPNEQVHRWAQDVVKQGRVSAGGVDGLGKKMGNHVAGVVQGFIADAVPPWRTATRLKNVPEDRGRGGGGMSGRGGRALK